MQSTNGADAAAGKHPRACESCYRAKAKCIRQAGRESDICSRCQRLQKSCVRPKQKPRKKRGPNVSATAAQLEQKIESLVALLSTGRTPAPSIVEPRSDVHVLVEPVREKPDIGCLQDAPSGSGDFGSDIPATVPANSCLERPAIGRYSACGIAALTPAGSVASDFEPRDERAEKLLNLFREQFAVHIPVEFISPDETPQELQATRPWLYRTVMMVACQDERSRQIEQGIQIARDMSDAMLIRGEKSLDMFQALLVYNTWGINFTPLNPQTMSAGFMQLTIAMMTDLGLNRPGRQEEGGLSDVERWALNDHTQTDLKRTLDERRAYLYCYFLTSTSSQCAKKIESFPTTPYLEYCCQILIDSAQSDLDIVLAYCVRLQAFTESIHRIVAECSDPGTNKAPIWMHMSSAKMALQNITTLLPNSVRQTIQLCMKYHSTEIFIYDSCIQKHLFPAGSSSQRLDMLYSCLLAAKGFLDLLLAQPQSNYLGYSIINCSQIGHGLSTIIKLAFVEEEGWNLPNVRETINLQFYFNQFISRFECAGEAIDRMQLNTCKASFPTGCSRALRRVLAACEAKLAAESDAAGSDAVAFQGQAGYVPLDESLPNITYDHLDDDYWEAIISGFTQ